MRSFRQYIFQEMDDEWIDKVADYMSPARLPFADIFDNKYRIVIPYTPATLTELKQEIEGLSNEDSLRDVEGKHKGKKYTVDLENGIVTITGKTGQGKEFVRKQNIGSFIQQTKDLKSTWKTWWNENGGSYSIIISRAPIDILRMSDFDHIESCHSQGGSYFKCAVSEAKGNGPIAYVVKNSDLKKIKDLQADEIFADRERDVNGIVPVARLRFRRYTNNKDDYDLAIPENEVYGHDDGNVVDAVTKWAQEAQKDVIGDEKPDIKDFTRKGGSYNSGNSDATLFSRFFGQGYNGRANYEPDEDDAEAIVERWEEEINEIDRETKFDNPVYTHAEAEVVEHEPYVNMSGGCNFEYWVSYVIKDIPNYKDWENHGKFIKQLEGVIGGYSPTHYNQVEAEQSGSGITINVDFQGHDFSANPNGYREFVSELEDFDENNYKEAKQAVWDELVSMGYLKPHYAIQIGQSHTQEDFKNFHFSREENGYPSFVSKLILLGHWDAKTLEKEPMLTYRTRGAGNQLDSDKLPMILQRFAEFLERELVAHSEKMAMSIGQQQYFPGFEQPRPYSFKERGIPLDPEVEFSIDKDNYLFAQVSYLFDAAEHTDLDVRKTLMYVKYIDQNFDKVVQLSQKIWSKMVAYIPQNKPGPLSTAEPL